SGKPFSLRDFAMLVFVAAAYWLVATGVCRELVVLLVKGMHQSPPLRIAALVLALIGIVAIGETVGRSCSRRAAIAVEVALAVATAVYWISDLGCYALADILSERPFFSISLLATSAFLLLAVVILPGIGAAFVLRLLRQSLRPRRR
ncbi:MAG TPA: hypothetical protein VM782_08475, partial [Stellaceae bacterium]|nr:hypothetical protein [Stellaceae bacterium]